MSAGSTYASISGQPEETIPPYLVHNSYHKSYLLLKVPKVQRYSNELSVPPEKAKRETQMGTSLQEAWTT